MDGASTCGTVARFATRKSTAFLVAFAAVLIGLICVQPAFAFELNASSGTAADNKGFAWTMAGGTLSVTIPTDGEYASYFGEGDIDSVLTVPNTMDGQMVTQVVTKLPCTNTVSAIKTLQYPKTITTMEGTTSSCFPNKLTSLTDFEFVGEGDPAVTVLGRKSSSGRGPHFPSTLVRFNAGEVDGTYYDVVIPSSAANLYARFFQGIVSSSLYIPPSIIIPSSVSAVTISGLPNLATVTNASNVWVGFPDCPNIATLNMLGTYTSIGASACSGWTNLEHFEVPEGITSIGNNAFKGCTSLTSFTIGGTDLVSIGDNAFAGTQLKTLMLPDSVKTIGVGAFADSSIEAVVLPDSVTDIGAGAFANSAITAVRIPASLFQGLNADQFTGEYIYGNVVIGRTAPLFIADFAEGSDINNVLTSVDLLSYQQSFLPSFMFAGCTALEEIAIPKTVTTLMPGVFLNCTSLKDVYYYGDPSSLSIAETKQVTHPFGYEYVAAGSFSVSSGTDPLLGGQLFSTMEGLSFYGLGISENNAVKTYAEENGSTFVPFAFLGEGGSSADVQDKFGYSVPVSNTVSIGDIMTGGAPAVTVGYPNEPDMNRTLVPVTDEAAGDCTVTYTLGGKEVSDFYTPGVYTAVITGDNESVWGTTTATFTVSAPEVIALPVTGDTGVTALGSLYGSLVPDGAKASLAINSVTSGPAYDALMAAKGQGILAGMYEVALMVNGEEVHSNFGSVTLTFPVDSQYNDHWATVWHYHANGVVTSERVVVSNGKVSVTVTDLSTFTIEIGDKVATGAEGLTMPVSSSVSPASPVTALASTGDSVPFVPFLVCLGTSLLIGLAVMFGRGRGSREA